LKQLLLAVTSKLIARGKRNKSGLASLNVERKRKPYNAPALSEPTLRQARLLVVGYAVNGHAGAQDLMPMLYPEKEPAKKEFNTKPTPSRQERAEEFPFSDSDDLSPSQLAS